MRIFFVGGGTLGSVTPLLATVPKIKQLRPEASFLWLGTANGPEAKLVVEAGLEFRAISAGKLRRYWDRRNFTDVVAIMRGFFECWRLFGQDRPEIVVSAGGYAAPPAVWAAWARRIPVHVHQMDIRPGLANKLAAPFARSVSVAFEKSLADYARFRPAHVGNPVRAELFDVAAPAAKRFFGFRLDVPLVLVMGGGTGADKLNRLIVDALSHMGEKVQLLHLTGPGKTLAVETPPIGYVQTQSLTSEMRQAYGAADLVVTRAGMGSLTELAALGLPAIILPMIGTHQEENAALFVAHGAARQFDETKLTPAQLAEAVVGLAHDTPVLAAMAKAMRRMNVPDAAEKLARAIVGSGGVTE